MLSNHQRNWQQEKLLPETLRGMGGEELEIDLDSQGRSKTLTEQ